MNNKSGKKRSTAGGILSVILALCAVFAVVMIFKKLSDKESNVTQSIFVSEKETTAEQPTDPHAGMARSRLTGEWVAADSVNNVPYAVMYSNIYDAMPQSNIGQADVVFESLVEGGITRLCCLFENKASLEKIGPVRSCRTYFLLFAKEFEAIYVHFGYSEYAESYLKKPSFHSLDGMVYCDFYRSSDRVAPHNAYTNWAGITDSAVSRGYETTYPDDYSPPFVFNTDDEKQITPQNGSPCLQLDMNYSYNKPWFEYDASSGNYLRYQFGDAQIDRESGQQLEFKNILIKYVTPAYYENGTPNYKIYGSGKGLYITNGTAAEVTWVKESESEGATRYYYDDGSEVVLNPGKTYVGLVENTQPVTIQEQSGN